MTLDDTVDKIIKEAKSKPTQTHGEKKYVHTNSPQVHLMNIRNNIKEYIKDYINASLPNRS